MLRLPEPCLVVTVGPSGAGKSTWAAHHFRRGSVVSSDALRALVGIDENDQRASKDAFAVLDDVVDRRLRRRLTTVVDSTALEADRRQRYVEIARRRRVPVYAVTFSTPAAECRARNKLRPRPVPGPVLTKQLNDFASVRAMLGDDGFTAVFEHQDVVVVPPTYVHAPEAARRQEEAPMALAFGLQIARFGEPGEGATIGPRLADVARAAEHAGFASVHVMDHFLQIPVVGREWEDMLDSYTTLGFLAGVTQTVRLGALVTGITYRNLAHLAKIVATLDVLSQGRAICGLGAAWHEREHDVYGWEFPAAAQRYALLEDALQLLPLMWGKGSPPFAGRTTTVPETICYPRPVQEHVPILVGGTGERRTLRLVAEHADACNLFGDADTVRRKIEVLHRHCADVGRDPGEIEVTHLSVAAVTDDPSRRPSPDVGTVEELVGRYRELAEAGVDTAIVGLAGPMAAATVERFAPVVAAFNRAP